MVQYEAYLQKTQEDWENRWENVKELINFASEMEDDLGGQSFDIESPAPDKGEDDWMDGGEDEYDEEELDDLGFAEVKTKSADDAKAKAEPETPLRAFLQASMLSTDTGQAADEKDKPVRGVIASSRWCSWPCSESDDHHLPCCQRPGMACSVYTRR